MTQAVRRKHHYIYRITRIDGSGKYYIGMHSTDDMNDTYFGSGSLLSKSIKKHGKDKHIKEILEHLPTREALKLREKEIVNKELLGDKLCMNLKLGGVGGFDHLNDGGLEHRARASRAAAKRNRELPKDIAKAQAAKATKTRRERGYIPWGGKHDTFTGKKHSELTKSRIGLANSKFTGKNNSQFGTCWIFNDEGSIKILKEEIESYLLNGFSKGRKIKAGLV